MHAALCTPPPRRTAAVAHPRPAASGPSTTCVQVQSVQHALALVATGEAHRKVSSTHFNEGSSRSHTLVRVSIESCAAAARDDRTISQFNLIDLAGSESARVATTHSHRKEGGYINKSLLTLGAVISKLAEGSAVHIPFRDSKITRLLQGSLSGAGAKVAVVCCVTPAAAQVCPALAQQHTFSRPRQGRRTAERARCLPSAGGGDAQHAQVRDAGGRDEDSRRAQHNRGREVADHDVPGADSAPAQAAAARIVAAVSAAGPGRRRHAGVPATLPPAHTCCGHTSHPTSPLCHALSFLHCRAPRCVEPRRR